ncbi:MAG TPA: hypothetical protein VFS62_15220 [Chloroflexota bacterium]|nr:hypothetical protein [Chloroflexota bacterium]
MWAHAGPWLGGPLFGLIWLAAIVVSVYLLVRYLRDRDGVGSSRARSILDERYARGEMTSEEYRGRVDHLR